MRFALILLLVTLCFALRAQELIPRAELFSERDPYQLKLSPDGERLYYQRRSVRDGRLFYRLCRRPGTEREINFEGALLDWKAVEDGILALVQQSGGKQQLHWVAASGARKDLPLFEFEQLRLKAVSGSQVAIETVSPADRWTGLFRLNWRSGSWEKLSPPLPYQEVFFDGQLRPRAARSSNELGGISISRYDGQQWVEAKRYPFDERQYLGGFQQVISVGKNGDWMYCLDSEGRDKTVLVKIHTRTGEEALLLADGKADLLPFGAMVSPQGRPQMVLSVFGEDRHHFLDASAQADFAYANRLLRGHAAYLQSSADGRRWLLARQAAGPRVYYLFDRGSRQLTRLLQARPGLQEYNWAEPSAHSLVARDGYELPVQVYLPAGSDADGDGLPASPLPTVLFVHGGPWSGVLHWKEWAQQRHLQLLANRGYAVINTEFRGALGLGQHFLELGDRQWGKAMQEDKVDIARWAIAQGIAEADALAIFGWSYGGYAAAAALAFSPELFQCGIALYGPMDLEQFSQTPLGQSDQWRKRVGDASTPEGRAELRAQSPAHRVGAIERPLLLAAGGKDGRVPERQMRDFARALHQRGKSVLYLYYPEEGHDFEQRESWASFWAAGERFLQQQLGGRRQAAGRDLENANLKIVYGQSMLDQED